MRKNNHENQSSLIQDVKLSTKMRTSLVLIFSSFKNRGTSPLFMKCLCLVKKAVNVPLILRKTKNVFEFHFSPNRGISLPFFFKIGDGF